jgi:hypothetical protein
MRICSPFSYYPISLPIKRMQQIDRELETLQGDDAAAHKNIMNLALQQEGGLLLGEGKTYLLSGTPDEQQASYTKIADLYAERAVMSSKLHRDSIIIAIGTIVMINVFARLRTLQAVVFNTLTGSFGGNLIGMMLLVPIGYACYQMVEDALKHQTFMERAKFAYKSAQPKDDTLREAFEESITSKFNDNGWSGYFSPSTIFPSKAT